MYRERRSLLDGAVVWTAAAAPQAEQGRVLPDGCMDLIWDGERVLVAGPDTVGHLVTRTAGTRYTGLRFPPGTGPAVLGVPAHELRDRRLPLDRLWPGGQARVLAERIAEGTDPARVLEAAAARRLRAGPPDPAYRAVAAALGDGRRVPAVAAVLGVSERQLHRRCLAAFGYGPKTLARILRMERALDLARAGTPAATVAAEAGYADQAHLSREVAALAGVPLGVLLAR